MFASSSSRFLNALTLLTWLSAALSVTGMAEAKSSWSWDTIKYVVAFGDSYSFVGGTLGHANFSFLGDAFNTTFTPAQVLSNELIPRNTSSEGSNWLHFLTGCFEGRPSDCAVQLWDMAFAGSDVSADLLPLHHDYTLPLVGQVDMWVGSVKDVVPHPANETLTVWWIGINDTGDSYRNTSISDFTKFYGQEMDAYFDAVKKSISNGLTGPHLFLPVPPEDRSPSFASNPTSGQPLKDKITIFNSLLSQRVSSLRAEGTLADVILWDAQGEFTKWLDDPATYGFSNVTGFCTCADASENGWFWYNTGHPTERVHRLIAESVRETSVAASV